MSKPRFRAAMRTFVATLSTTIALTVKWLAPDVPEELLIAWGGVVMAAVGLAEGWYDSGKETA